MIAPALVASLLAGAPSTAGDGRLGVLVVATGPSLEAQAGQLQGALEDELSHSHTVARWGDLVGVSTDSIHAVQRLRKLVEVSFKSCSAMVDVCNGSHADEAVAALEPAAAAALPQDVQRTYAAVAATRWGMNLPQDAENAALMALSIDPGLPAPQVTSPPGFDELWQRCQFAARDRSHTSLDVSSVPSGARILIDGVPKGFTPASVQGIAQGAHLVQLERIGYQTAGAVVSLSGVGMAQSLRLASAPGFRPLDVVAAAQAAEQGGGGLVAQIAGRYGLSYLVVGILTPKSGGSSSFELVAVRSTDAKVLGKQRISFDADEYGTAGRTAGRAADELFGSAYHDADKHKSGDPLDNVDGTEGW